MSNFGTLQDEAIPSFVLKPDTSGDKKVFDNYGAVATGADPLVRAAISGF